MLSGFAKHRDEQIARPIDDSWTLGEAADRVHKAADVDEFLNLLERANRRLDVGQRVQGADLRRLIAGLDRLLASNLAGVRGLSVRDADCPRAVQQVAGPHGRQIIAPGDGRGWQFESKFGKL